jgi:hypothetical protein
MDVVQNAALLLLIDDKLIEDFESDEISRITGLA